MKPKADKIVKLIADKKFSKALSTILELENNPDVDKNYLETCRKICVEAVTKKAFREYKEARKNKKIDKDKAVKTSFKELKKIITKEAIVYGLKARDFEDFVDEMLKDLPNDSQSTIEDLNKLRSKWLLQVKDKFSNETACDAMDVFIDEILIPTAVENIDNIKEFQDSNINKRLKVLILDDEKMICDYMQFILDREGFITFPATKQEEALDIFKKEKPDICIVDIVLNPAVGETLDNSGLIFIREARKSDPTCAFVIISGYFDPELEKERERLEVDAFIAKPVELDDLRIVLNEIRKQKTE
ncbi:MAG: response regulator [Candidatus Omnitrophica bacterium]|nr:response regulator [Candidatus Omnitrophota bacterium]